MSTNPISNWPPGPIRAGDLAYQLLSLLYESLDYPERYSEFSRQLSAHLGVELRDVLLFDLEDGSSLVWSNGELGSELHSSNGLTSVRSPIENVAPAGELLVFLWRDEAQRIEPNYRASPAPASEGIAVATVANNCVIELRFDTRDELAAWCDEGKLALMKYLLPHFATVHQVRRKQQTSAAVVQNITAIHQMMPFPIVLWSSAKRHVHANSEALRSLALLVPGSSVAEGDWNVQQHLGLVELVKLDTKKTVQLLPLHQLENLAGYEAYVIATPTLTNALNIDVLRACYELSAVEAELCCYVLRGLAPTEIAKQVNQSINTIKSRLKTVYRACGVSSVGQLAARLLLHPTFWTAHHGKSHTGIPYQSSRLLNETKEQ